jgi:ABC-2 type transport system ATP-binding protein
MDARVPAQRKAARAPDSRVAGPAAPAKAKVPPAPPRVAQPRPAGPARPVGAAAAPRARAPPAIETRGLTKRYGDRASVDGLTISIPRGQVVGFVGPNGAGKTTTIRMLLGLITPSAGQARVLGCDIRDPLRYLPRVGALIESPAFYANLSAEANLRVFCRLGGFDESRIPVLLRQVGLGDRGSEAFKGYSLGMKQRLGIAAALLPDPDLLILDEPTNGLDPAGILEVRTFLRALGDSGKTVFVSSHLLSEIEKMCDHVVMLRKGRLVFQGTIEELSARGAGLTLVAEDPAHHPRLAELCRRAGHDADATAERVLVRGVTPSRAGALNRAAMKAGITLRELRPGSSDLEQTFLDMTGEGEL